MIAQRQFSPEAIPASEPVAAVAINDFAGTSGDSGPARQLQAKLADAIGHTPQNTAWQVDFGHRSGFDTAMVPQQAKSIVAGLSGGAFIAMCLFLILD